MNAISFSSLITCKITIKGYLSMLIFDYIKQSNLVRLVENILHEKALSTIIY